VCGDAAADILPFLWATVTPADGDYINSNITCKLHVNAAVTGSCQTYVQQGGQCQLAFLYKHTAVKTDQSVTGYPSTPVVLGSLNVQSYDTCRNGNCTPVNTLQNGSSWATATPGVYVYSAQNVAGGGTSGTGGQSCNMSHSYPSTNAITLHALACVSVWRLDLFNNIVHPANYATTNVYIPPSIHNTDLDLAVQAAIAGWN
jgi:hypothetical protein